MSEKCQRCGEEGEDRRTLFMECFYEMSELKIPFDNQILFHANVEECEPASDPVVLEVPNGPKIPIQAGTVKCSGELTPSQFYCLRVCKHCRAEWMQAIKEWFFRPSYGPSPGTRIFVRDLGATNEITREEWDRRMAEGHPKGEGA